jgi:hypothetical protein
VTISKRLIFLLATALANKSLVQRMLTYERNDVSDDTDRQMFAAEKADLAG